MLANSSFDSLKFSNLLPKTNQRQRNLSDCFRIVWIPSEKGLFVFFSYKYIYIYIYI